jgi:putative transposase
MPRANRHYIPGYVWHITHRCHKKEFLLKFARDRRIWIQWLFEARKRYGLSVLSYMVTSNHIHLLVRDNGERDVIPNAMQLIAGRMGQTYNQRKKRKGAYWEDRYHATAVETDSHLIQCLVYIEMNMVRAGVVRHPSEWPFSGYREIQAPRKRYAIIDHKGLIELLNVKDKGDLATAYRGWVEEAVTKGDRHRDGRWADSVAVGSESFVKITREKLGIKGKGREVIGTNGSYALREAPASYNTAFAHKNQGLKPQNTYFWNTYDEISAA